MYSFLLKILCLCKNYLRALFYKFWVCALCVCLLQFFKKDEAQCFCASDAYASGYGDRHTGSISISSPLRGLVPYAHIGRFSNASLKAAMVT